MRILLFRSYFNMEWGCLELCLIFRGIYWARYFSFSPRKYFLKPSPQLLFVIWFCAFLEHVSVSIVVKRWWEFSRQTIKVTYLTSCVCALWLSAKNTGYIPCSIPTYVGIVSRIFQANLSGFHLKAANIDTEGFRIYRPNGRRPSIVAERICLSAVVVVAMWHVGVWECRSTGCKKQDIIQNAAVRQGVERSAYLAHRIWAFVFKMSFQVCREAMHCQQ